MIHLCPLDQTKRFVSKWQLRGTDKCCSYCGSWHPKEFLKFLPEVTNNNDYNVRIELSDRKNKIYVDRPDIKNAGEGAIKVYLIHIRKYIEEMEFNNKEIIDQINKAIHISAKKAQTCRDKIFDKLKD